MAEEINALPYRIVDYYVKRGLKMPDVWQSLAWAQTELAEVYELLLDREGGWVRNHPENKPKFSREALGEELGDTIMMLIVAGLVEGIDPVQSMEDKLKRTLWKLGLENEPSASLELPAAKTTG